jgi:hypothetical protein
MGRNRSRKANDLALTPELFREEFDESFADVLDLRSWRPGRDPGLEYARISQEIADAVASETDSMQAMRERVLARLKQAMQDSCAGHFQAEPDRVAQVQQHLLFQGKVECCDGTNMVHDTLAATIYQIGVALVSYHGQENCWQQQLFRRDLRLRSPDPDEAVLDLLEHRENRPGFHSAAADPLSELARRGITSYMERYLLAREAKAEWRMGHGSPAPLELIATGYSDLVVRSIRIIRELIQHRRFVFIASEQANRGIFFIGQALRPMEYAVIDTLANYPGLRKLDDWTPHAPTLEDLHWNPDDPQPLPLRDWVKRFRDEVAPQVVYGVYRATRLAPPHLFFAHRDVVHLAAHIALADSRLLEERGFPMLIDVADRTCRAVYSDGSLVEMAEAAYAQAGAPFRFQSERLTRPRG